MSDTQDIRDLEESEEFSLADVIEVVDRSYRVIAWVGPHILRVEGHA